METDLLKPPQLKQGEGIGVIAPAGPVTRSEIQPGIKLLNSSGYNVVSGPHLYHKKGYVAGEDEERLEDLHSMFINNKVKAIICARGGYGSLRLLNRIDFDLIQRNPKIIVGYSDITALLLAIYKKTHLITFHGPVVKDISKNNNRNLTSFFDLVSSGKSLKLDLSGGRTLMRGKVSGTLLGGNLSLISSLMGTPFMPSLKGAILLIEEKDEPLYRVDRMLTHLRLSGSLDDLAGLLAGGFEDCGDMSSINNILLDTVSDLNIPLISGLPVGHGLENITLPLGLPCTLDTNLRTLSFTESCVIKQIRERI